VTGSTGELEIDRQKRSNANAFPLHAAFANHRRHLTDLVLARALSAEARAAVSARSPSLCVLGAGNCADLDLDLLASSYHSIHLVDIDEQAVARALAGQAEGRRAAFSVHAPIDLSGLLGPLARWREMRVTPDEVMAHPELASARLAERLGGPFDVVVSACVLSQMHLSVRNILSDNHPLFHAANYTLTLTHLRTLARLTEPGGVALLASDIATEEMAPLRGADERSDFRALLAHQLARGAVFDAVRPDTISRVAEDDPSLARELAPAVLADVWVWENGPRRTFLVYALDFARQR
jgi:hypothetical protein